MDIDKRHCTYSLVSGLGPSVMVKIGGLAAQRLT